MEITEQITHLLLDEGADGYHRYQVTVPARIAEEMVPMISRPCGSSWTQSKDGGNTGYSRWCASMGTSLQHGNAQGRTGLTSSMTNSS